MSLSDMIIGVYDPIFPQKNCYGRVELYCNETPLYQVLKENREDWIVEFRVQVALKKPKSIHDDAEFHAQNTTVIRWPTYNHTKQPVVDGYKACLKYKDILFDFTGRLTVPLQLGYGITPEFGIGDLEVFADGAFWPTSLTRDYMRNSGKLKSLTMTDHRASLMGIIDAVNVNFAGSVSAGDITCGKVRTWIKWVGTSGTDNGANSAM